MTFAVPPDMRAAVWRGGGEVAVERVPVPAVGPGELLVRVEACGLCPTDIKKIDLALCAPPVILGHETAGAVVVAGEGRGEWLGRRVAVYHHVPCRACRFCGLRLYSQCPGYRRTGTTAGFAPAGGGWAEYVKVLPWIVDGGGVVAAPEGMPRETVILMEPVNTCLRCVRCLSPSPGTVVILGLGPIGLMLAALAARDGWNVLAVEPLQERRIQAGRFGAGEVFAPTDDLAGRLRARCAPDGPDAVIAATEAEAAIGAGLAALRPGGALILFAHTRRGQPLTIDGGEIGMREKHITGSYSSSIDLNGAVLEALGDARVPWERLVTHVFPLGEINAALALARRPRDGSLKIAVAPEN